MAHCVNHHERITYSYCFICFRDVCSKCRIYHNRKVYCLRCAFKEKLINKDPDKIEYISGDISYVPLKVRQDVRVEENILPQSKFFLCLRKVVKLLTNTGIILFWLFICLIIDKENMGFVFLFLSLVFFILAAGFYKFSNMATRKNKLSSSKKG